MTQPLAGRRVLVTRAAHQAGKLSDGLRALGADPVEVPVIEIRPPVSYDPLDDALRLLESYDWLILTSANTVRVLAERAAAFGIVFGEQSPQVAAVGKATADAAREAGFAVSVVPARRLHATSFRMLFVRRQRRSMLWMRTRTRFPLVLLSSFGRTSKQGWMRLHLQALQVLCILLRWRAQR